MKQNPIGGFLGIDNDRLEIVIDPMMKRITAKGGKVDAILMEIEESKEIDVMEKIYCSYSIGVMIGKGNYGRIQQVKTYVKSMLGQ
jgi:hypothetical protein